MHVCLAFRNLHAMDADMPSQIVLGVGAQARAEAGVALKADTEALELHVIQVTRQASKVPRDNRGNLLIYHLHSRFRAP